ncbi:ribonuclease domain-containing protein [Bacillus halotolerans]|uniref:ribonuclease domain-containing protein n=1 Tax=Bacillus halotolerans TaxID=260554 RepID=UPI0021523280|nr:ribonuclease domain-containing protein [Bacillus halotolerans]
MAESTLWFSNSNVKLECCSVWMRWRSMAVPYNYINKGEARKLGWESKKGNLSKVAPGKSIGGDIYKNREKIFLKLKIECGAKLI